MFSSVGKMEITETELTSGGVVSPGVLIGAETDAEAPDELVETLVLVSPPTVV